MRALVLALALVSVCTAAQADDRSYLTAFLEGNLSGAGRKVTVTGFEGALSSKATVQQLTIADDEGIWLTLRDVSLDWNRAAIFSGELSVNSLTAGEIVLDRLPTTATAETTPEASPFALPELPVSVQIGALVAERIVLGASVLGTPVEGKLAAALSLVGGEGRASLTLERTDDGPAGMVVLDASYTNAGKMLAIDLDAREDAGGIAAGLLGIPGQPSVALVIAGKGPLSDFVAEVGLETDGVSRLAGQVQITGQDDGGLGFAADLGGDLAPVFWPAYAEFFGPSVTLFAQGRRWTDGRMELLQLAVKAEALEFSGQVALAADGLPESFDVTGRIGLEDGAPVLLPLTADVATRIDSADLALHFDASVDDGWSIRATVLGLDRADLRAQALELNGTGRIARQAGARQFKAALDFVAAGLAFADPGLAMALGGAVTGAAQINWTEGDGVVSVPRLQVASAGYEMVADGTVSGLADALLLSGRVKARIDDLSRLSGLAGRGLSGSAIVDLKGTGSPLSGAFDLEGSAEGRDMATGISEVDNLLRGDARIEVSVQRDVSGTTLRRLNLRAATLTAEASGQLASEGSALDAALNFTDIGELGPGYRGQLTGQATFRGTMADGKVTLDATGRDLGIAQTEVDGLLQGESKVSLILGLTAGVVRIETASLTNPQLQAHATGALNGPDSKLDADVSLADLAVLGPGYRGALAGKMTFTGALTDGRVTLDATGRNLAIGQTEADKLLRGESRLALDLTLTTDGVQIETAKLTNPQVEAGATGTLQGARQTVELNAQIKNLGLLLPQFPGALRISGRAIQEPAGTTIDLKGTGPGRIDALVKGRLDPGFRGGDLTIRGTAQAALANAFIGSRSVSGGLGFDLRMNGPLRPESLSGTVTLADGRLADPGQQFALERVSVRADLAGGRAGLTVSADVSTGGRIAMKGSVGLAAAHDGALEVDLERVTLRDPDLYETTANGALTVTGPLTGGAMIAGRIVLTETELRVPSTGFGGAGDLPGLRHSNEQPDERATRERAGLIDGGAGGVAFGPSFGLDVTVSAPNRLFVRGRGLDAELGGELRLSGTTAAVSPAGSFSLIRGRLDILGKRLNLSEALLQLQGELVPFLRIVASTENDGIISSVVIEGPATDPVVSFTSQPELPEEEVLAQLLFGQTLQDLSAFQALQLASAVGTLAGKGGDGIVGKLRKGIGLDNLDVKTATDGTASITAGKYLTKNIYSEVTVDQSGQSQINLNLDVSPTITLRGRASSDGTAGIGIFLEKDY